MPLHDFHCRKCEMNFDRLVRGDTPITCPGCGSDQVDKLLSAPQAPGRSKDIIAAGRAAAAREGHFSNYSASDQARTRRR
ncbi:zinc ribbon domain-containing protein [Methyloversatilis sp. XJ19-13]|uniref:FmdB family zinc ribbon protein n=1 Tax=Methyloversatilis sp. XJ19-13 TaxID=2963430 RepID=UPI00211BEBBC|nr:zinc ribbon domain-containing protein [Methyloversatilis sp. XJ19-13]MCQ9372728.1 zinc ribbon domain-containing protein [Methyloversatilis sp. XJ19-13]